MLKLTLIGNLGSDPDMRYSANGSPLLRFNVAGNYRAKNDAGEWEDRTEWVRVTVFGNRAESLSNLLRKGSKVFIDGRLEARPWTGNDGALHAGLEVVANEVELCSPRQQDDGQQMRPTNTVNRQQQGATDDRDLESLPF
jgi:single-strand DNA-binding protein